VAALSYAGAQVLTAGLAIPVVLLGGQLHAFLIASVAASAVVLVAVWRAMRREGVGKIRIDWAGTRKLLIEGNAFLVLSGVMVLQPTIDAFFLARGSSDDVIGWHAAAKKMQIALITPAGALIGALYPTLCRLWVDNKEEFARTTTGALRACTVVMVPLALGCYLFAELGVQLFNKNSFGPAEDNLKVLSISVLMVYLSMTVGTCLAASGKARAWTIVQVICVAVRGVANPVLIPYFQEHYGNGGLGVCWATAANEVLLVVIGVSLMPRGIFDRSMLKIALQAGGAGLAMVVVARLLPNVTQFVVAPLAVLVYFVVLYAVGGIEKRQVESIKGMVRRKILRR
jgi:O-antigen/teichoic acid export membrane protein